MRQCALQHGVVKGVVICCDEELLSLSWGPIAAAELHSCCYQGSITVNAFAAGIQVDASEPSAALAYAQAVHAAQIPNPAINLDPT